MKKFCFYLTIFLFAFSLSVSAAQESLPLDASISKTPQATAASNLSKELSMIVTADGQLISKAGTLFSEGNTAGLSLPYLISTPKPIQYPRWALSQGWEGDFIIAVEILLDGSVGRFRVMKSTGHKALDQAATDAVKTWKFQPAMREGKAVVECIQVPVRFQLKSE